MQPNILVINDDQQLCESRRLLLESCGARVSTACGKPGEVEQRLREALDLVLIDATNVGFERAEFLCELVRKFDQGIRVALLAKPEMGLPETTLADHVIARTGPRRMLVEVNELLDERLDVNLWESGTTHGDTGSTF